ncbi:uncharacterized protein LOC105184397 isoform X2 [Harpegnathos saltator]|uniref:uncharacterized protein LOC105184397 isoform X2 n=1 Tax=Harpegnathos saltator TaxID=610380 RepID=UPI00058BA996|nr:uncharacterized protein LOC105184397 isoform X2 [Harpegnathos saltator]XP_019697517.1 uncharacterized protein LOC105184397 isoform X2 [Harpegnathos saltator]
MCSSSIGEQLIHVECYIVPTQVSVLGTSNIMMKQPGARCWIIKPGRKILGCRQRYNIHLQVVFLHLRTHTTHREKTRVRGRSVVRIRGRPVIPKNVQLKAHFYVRNVYAVLGSPATCFTFITSRTKS